MALVTSLKSASGSLQSKAGRSDVTNDTESGHLLKIALALEGLAGQSTSANANRFGYMLRAAKAAEKTAANLSPAGKNDNEEGLLHRIVAALEVKAGGASSGSMEKRLVTAAANAVFP